MKVESGIDSRSIRGSIVNDLGSYIFSVASLEFELDNLFGLANSRLDVVALGIKNYPLQLSQKVDCLPTLAEAVGCKWDNNAFFKSYDRVSNLRQLLAHGRITGFDGYSANYSVKISKMSRPERVDGLQKLEWKSFSTSANEIEECLMLVKAMELNIEDLRVKIWEAGEGWPTFLATPTNRPFCADETIENLSRKK